jgi:CHAT domain-containing protein
MRILPFLTTFLFTFSAFTQKPPVPSKGKILIDKGYEEYLKNNYSKAIATFESAAKQCQIDKDTSETLQAFGLIYGVLNTENKKQDFLRYEKTLLNYLSNKNIQVISICNVLGGAYQANTDFDKAQYYYELAIKKIKDKKVLDDELLYLNGMNNNLLGGLMVTQGDYEKGMLSQKASLNSFLNIKKKIPSDWLEIGKQYFTISDLYLEQKQYSQANKYLQKAHPLIQKEDFYSQIGYHQNMGILFNPDALNKPDSALFHLKQALQLQVKYNLQDQMGKTYEILGKVQYAEKDFKAAQSSFQKALGLRLLVSYFRPIASSEKNIGMALVQQKQYVAALGHFQKALQYVSTDFKSNNFADNPSVQKLKYKNDAIEILKEKMAVLLVLYRTRNGKTDLTSPPTPSPMERGLLHSQSSPLSFGEGSGVRSNGVIKPYLSAAYATAQTAKQLIDFQRNSFQLEGSKLFLSQQAHEVFGLGIEAAYLLFETTKDEQFLAEAFKFSENNKAVVLYESVKASQALSFQGVPTELLVQEHKLIKDMAVFENQLIKDVQNEALWRKKLLETTDKLKALKTDFEQNYPAYFKYKYDAEPITPKEIQAKLSSDNQSVIEYFIHDNSLFIFLINAKKSYFFKQNLPADFKQNIVDFKAQIINKTINESYKNLSFKIYQTLFPSNITRILEAENTKRIKIIADGELNYIPFESLLVRQSKSLKEANIYLLEKYIIGYLPSATMNWKSTIPKTDKSLSLKYLGFAPNYGKSLDLPQNQANVSFLSDLFHGKSFVKEQGTKASFEEQSQNRTKILHLSMHAGASPNDPMKSYLAFRKDSLFVHDIYARNIPSELAILDACETGVGVLNNGEGVMNLSRAFMHAGSQSVAMSLWKLTSSSETSEIIRDFVSLVENGKAKDEALSIAKRNYLRKHRKDLVLSHPFYWSPLILVGNADAIVERSWFWRILGGVGLVVLIGVWVRRGRKLLLRKPEGL